MLVLKRKIGQSILVGKDIEIILLSMDNVEAKLGFFAPDDINIIRYELRRHGKKRLPDGSLVNDV